MPRAHGIGRAVDTPGALDKDRCPVGSANMHHKASHPAATASPLNEVRRLVASASPLDEASHPVAAVSPLDEVQRLMAAAGPVGGVRRLMASIQYFGSRFSCCLQPMSCSYFHRIDFLYLALPVSYCSEMFDSM